MIKNYLSLIVVCFISFSLQAQWINFNDETTSRITISNISDNADSNAVDDQEKDLITGDFNNDTFIDLMVVRKVPFSSPGAKTDLLFLNNGAGVLEDKTDLYAPEFLTDATDARDVISVDVNADNWLDLFIVSTFGDQPKLYINQGNDTNGVWLGFQDESTRLPTLTLSIIQFCAGWSGDVNGDNAPDLYMINYDPSGLSLDVLFMNDGNGNFTDESTTRLGDLRNSSFGTGVEMHDIDDDGDLDIIKNLGLSNVAPFNNRGTIALYNNGDGTFTNFQKFPGNASYMFTAGDLNNDGMLDFYEVDDGQDYINQITAMIPDDTVTINQEFINSDRTDTWGGNVKMVDIDGDGDLDVTIASVDTDEPPCNTENNDGGTGGSRTFVIFENDNLFSGDIVDPYSNITSAWNISNYDQDFIDINNDGLMDLILGTCDGYAIFMQENTLSVNDDSLQSLSIYPNPSSGRIQINLVDSILIEEIKVYNLNGSLVNSFSKNSLVRDTNTITIDLTDSLYSGVYFLNFTTETTTITKKLVIN